MSAHPTPGSIEVARSFTGSIFEAVVLAIETVCVAVLVAGVVTGIAMLLRAHLSRCVVEWRAIRLRVGMHLLFALELLVAADIIETMIDPSHERLIILGGVSAIRIATGIAIARELAHLTGE